MLVAATDLPALGTDKRANNAYAFACPHAVATAPEDAYPRARGRGGGENRGGGRAIFLGAHLPPRPP